MSFKYKLPTLDGLPENHKIFYKSEGSEFVLDTEGVVSKDKLDEFRNNNIQLQQQLDKLKDVDPVKYRELINLDRQVKEGELIKAGKLDEVVNLRVGEMRTTLQAQIDEQQMALSTSNQQLSLLLIDNQVKSAAIALGVHSTAVDDIVLRARTVYQVEKGSPVPKDGSGNIIYGKDGSTPMSIDDWAMSLKKTAPHLFVGSMGSGAGGGRGAGNVDVSKMTPSQKISYGLTQGGLQTAPR